MKSFFKIGLLAIVLAVAESAVASETYRIDPAHSVIGFSVHQLFGTTKGTFTRFTGTIELDRAHPENSTVDAKIEVASIETGISKRDQHLRSADFFDAAKFPDITFKSRRVTRTGADSAEIAGDLTLHGVTKPVTLHVTLASPLPADSAKARTQWEVRVGPLRRSDYGLLFSKNAEAISRISEEVAIELKIAAMK